MGDGEMTVDRDVVVINDGARHTWNWHPFCILSNVPKSRGYGIHARVTIVVMGARFKMHCPWQPRAMYGSAHPIALYNM